MIRCLNRHCLSFLWHSILLECSSFYPAAFHDATSATLKMVQFRVPLERIAFIGSVSLLYDVRMQLIHRE